MDHRKTLFSTSGIFLVVALLLCIPRAYAQETEVQKIKLLDVLPSDTLFYGEINNLQDQWKTTKSNALNQTTDKQKEKMEAHIKNIKKKVSSLSKKTLGIDPGPILSNIERVQFGLTSIEAEVGQLGNAKAKNISAITTITASRADVFNQLFNSKAASRIEKKTTVGDYSIYKVKVKEKKKIKNADINGPFLLTKGASLHISTDESLLKTIAAGTREQLPSRPLRENDSFQSLSEETSTRLFVFGNLDAVWSAIEDSLPKEGAKYYQKLSSSLGFTEMTSAHARLSMEDQWINLHGGVNISKNGFPLYDLVFRAPSDTIETLKQIPAESIVGMAGHLPDLSGNLPEIKKKYISTMTKFGQPEKKVTKQWDQVMAMSKGMYGASPKEILNQLGEEIGYYLLPVEKEIKNSNEFGQALMKNFTLILDLSNPEETKSLISNMMNARGMKQFKKMKSTVSHNGSTIHTFKMGPDKPAVTYFFDNGHLILTGSVEAARTFLDEKKKSILEAKWFQEARVRLPKKVTWIQAVNQKKYLRMIKNLSKLQKQQMKNIENTLGEDLPASQELIMNMFSGGSNNGALSSYTTTPEKILLQTSGKTNFSGIDVEAVNTFLKKISGKLDEKIKAANNNETDKEESEK